MADDKRCTICDADFRPEAMVGKKCKLCEATYPNAKTKADIKPNTKQKAQTLEEGRVREIVYEILVDAGLPRHKCEKCGESFFRRKPMQKVCHKCTKDEKGDN